MNDTTMIEPVDAAPVVERPRNPVAVFRGELDKLKDQFASALPVHIPVERFVRVLMTAVQNNPSLLAADRRSFWNAAMRAAQDGLLPDGREGAIVLYGKQAQWMPMIAGIRKKVRNSGEIATWEVHVVHANDDFTFELGDEAFIRHKPTLGDPGATIAAYSIATLKSGEKSREVMSVAAIEKVRAASKAGKGGPWVQWYDEMCRKTVARRHAKVLPMSTDLDDLIRRDDELYDFKREGDAAPPAERPKTLAGRLDALVGIAAPTLAPAVDEDADPDTGEVAEVPDKIIEASVTTEAPSVDPDEPAEGAGKPTEAPAAQAAPVGLTGEMRTALMAFAKSAESTEMEKTLDRGTAAFLKDKGIVEGTAAYEAVREIVSANRLRIAGKSSPAEVDAAVKKALAA